MDLIKQVKIICDECLKLKNQYVSENGLIIDWVCVFSQSDNEYSDLVIQAQKIGNQIEITDNGIIFELIKKINTPSGVPKVLKVRKFDSTRPEMGDVDFITEYSLFKQKYITHNHFNLIKKDKFEMLELMDKDFNVRVYFSSIPPSKLRGIE